MNARQTARRFGHCGGVLATAALIAALATAAPRPSPAHTTEVWISPGFTLCWTFGYGVTYGVELSVIWVWLPDSAAGEDFWELPPGVGMTFDLNFDGGDFFLVSMGAQVTGPFFGLEISPSLVTTETGAHFGLGFSPWVSSYVIPFYNGIVIFDETPNIHQLGAYFKLHLNTDGNFGDADEFDD
jgi:hypothetical protein